MTNFEQNLSSEKILDTIMDLLNEERMARLHERMGIAPAKISPYHNVTSGVPPKELLSTMSAPASR